MDVKVNRNLYTALEQSKSRRLVINNFYISFGF